MRRFLERHATGADVFLIVLIALFQAAIYVCLPTDTEELSSTLFGSVMMWASTFNGGQPLWTPMLGLGTELPFRFGVLIHPLGPLFAVLPPYKVMGLVVFTHLIIAGLFFRRLVAIYVQHRWWRLVVTLSFLATPSVIQPLFVDDWLANFITTTLTPALLYATYRLAQGGPRRDMVMYGLIGGVACGVSTSTGFPVVQVFLTALFYISLRLSRPKTTWAEEIRTILWCIGLIGGVTALIGLAQIYSLSHFVQLSPASALRMDHPEPPFSKHLQSYFFRAFTFTKSETYPWRSAWIGTWAGVVALGATLTYSRRRQDWGLVIPFALSLACMFIPPRVFGDLITNTWAYRNGVEVFGLLLAGMATERLFRSPRLPARIPRARAFFAVTVLQAVLMAVPVLALVVSKSEKRQTETWKGYDPEAFYRENTLFGSLPNGRIAATPKAHVLIGSSQFVNRGLILNAPVFSGLPTLNMESRGVSQDRAYPDSSLLNGLVTAQPTVLRDSFLRQFWDITTVVSLLPLNPEEGEAEMGHVVRTVSRSDGVGIALHIPTAAAEQVAVLTQPVDVAALPLLPDCPNNRVLCRDIRAAAPHIAFAGTLHMTADMVTVSLPPASHARTVLLPLLWNAGLRAQDQNGEPLTLTNNGELVQLSLSPQAVSVVVSYESGIRGDLYILSAVSLALSCLGLIGLPLYRRVR